MMGNVRDAFNMRRMMQSMKADSDFNIEDLLVIGIDFGTTYSGAAWATIEDFEAENINMIISWPGHGREEGKAPTAIYYDNDSGETRWGYDVSDEVSAMQWFKLLLLRPDDVPVDVKESNAFMNAKRMLKESGKPAVDVISDYLRVLWRHVMDTIVKERGEYVVDILKIHVVLTVPAIWKGYARQDMKKAAHQAGILTPRDAGPTTLSFAPEPEAAALATLCEPGRSIAKGDVYILCDAGGGTVDLVIYKITSTDPVQLYEVGIGTGGLCGGIFLDEAFRDIVKDRLGRGWNKLSRKGENEIMTKEWEVGIKPKFNPDDRNKEHIVSIPAEAFGKSGLNDDSKRPVIKNGRIHFSSSDVKKVFTGVFSSIERLIDDQVRQARKANLAVTGIILVGGLGTNSYLHQHLKSRYKPKGIEVLQSAGIKPRTAISRGAVFKGFIDGPQANTMDARPTIVPPPISVISSVARESIGVVVRKPFINGVHRREDRMWNQITGEHMADHQMRWLVKKGDHVPHTKAIKYRCQMAWDSPSDYRGTQKIWFCHCDADEPPEEERSPLVTRLCELDCRLGVPYESLESFQVPVTKRWGKRAQYDIKMVLSGATVEFSASYGGNLMKSEDVSIEYT